MRFGPEIAAASTEHQLPAALVCAVIDRETAGTWSPWSHRWERGYRYLWHPTDHHPVRLHRGAVLPPDGWPSWVDRISISGGTEFNDQRTSWGLMHVMGAVARELGFVGELTELCEPRTGLHFGCLHLARLVRRHGMEDGLEAYNDGKADDLGPGEEYAADVLARMEEYRDVSMAT